MSKLPLSPLGSWRPGRTAPVAGSVALRDALGRLEKDLRLVDLDGQLAAATGGELRLGARRRADSYPLLGFAPPLLPDQLGSSDFRAEHGAELAVVGGAMANGIASEDLVEAMAGAGMLAFFGAAGCSLPRIEAAILRLKGSLDTAPWGMNLIHSPGEPEMEAATVELYLKHGVSVVSASAYIDLTPSVVRYRVTGLKRDAGGRVVAPNKILAKVSRTEVARRFLAPPPKAILDGLVADGLISASEAELASEIPMAEDITAEADSGGHTDNRPLVVLLPELLTLRDKVSAEQGYVQPPRVGAAGGISTPASTAAAFAMGAAYVVLGSVLQACVESGSSDTVRQMLAQAAAADVTMAPAADMFELGVELQVLSKGTLFPVRARKLYQLYREYPSLEALPEAARTELEKKVFQRPLELVWADCESYWSDRDLSQIERASSDPKHKMALVFRSYLGQSSRWANDGVPERRMDYQVWSGPSMGAFNDWARGSFLEAPERRSAVVVVHNLMAGAALRARAGALQVQGLDFEPQMLRWEPLEAEPLAALYRRWEQSGAEEAVALDAEAESPSDRPRFEGGNFGAVAIVGMDCMFPKAADLSAFWHLLRTGLDAVGEVPETHWSPEDYWDADKSSPDRTYARRGAFLDPYDFDPTEFGIPPNILEATDTSQLLGLVVAGRALADAGCPVGGDWDRSKTSVILGVTGTQELVISLGARLGHPHWWRALQEAGVSEEQAKAVVDGIGKSYVQWQESSFPGLLGNVVAGRIANRFDLGGTNCVTDAACASSLAAVHLACMELQLGRADRVVTGGVDALNDIFMHMCFSKTPALSPTGDARPFSDKADGTILGEGVGMLVLRRLEDAERDGDRIYGVIRSVGTSSDGRAKSIYAPLPAGQARALRDAYEQAGVSPSDIELVEAHGTGTSAGDACEFEALRDVYEQEPGQASWVALGSVKSQIGHTKAAAGAAGLIKAALALHHKVIPPTIKVDAPNPGMDLETSPFFLPLEARPWSAKSEAPRRAAVSSFGFGGSDFHMVVEEYRRQRVAPAWDGAVQIAPLSGETVGELLEGLEQLSCGDYRHACAAARRSFSRVAARRLVLVASSASELSERIAAARTKLQASPDVAWTMPMGAHYGLGAPDGDVAVVFPGQGSQYPGMLGGLAAVFPEFLEALSEDEELTATLFPPSTFDEVEKKNQQAQITSTDVAQPSLGLVESAAFDMLSRFGLCPAMAAGHSFGELVALYAAGRLSRSELRHLAAERGRLMAGDGSERGTMLAVLAPLADIEALIDEAKLDVVLANRNSPAQGVLSGSRDAIKTAQEACQARGLRFRQLEVAAAFHSELVAGVRDDFAAVVGRCSFPAGSFPVFANSNAETYPTDASECVGLLSGQLAEPVRWVESILGMHQAGARTFIEIGPGRSLSGMVGRILDGAPHRCIALDGSKGRKDALVELAELLAVLVADGHSLDLSGWQDCGLPAPRKPKMVVPITGANVRDPRARSQVTVAKPKTLPPMAAETAAPKAMPSPSRTPSHASLHSPMEPSMPKPSSSPGQTLSTAAVPAAPRPASGETAAYALQTAQQSLAALQAMQQQTARIHEQFLQGQLAAQQSFQTLLQGQQALVHQALAGGVMPVEQRMVVPSLSPAPTPSPVAAAPMPFAPVAPASTPVAAAPMPVASVAAASAPVPSLPQAAAAPAVPAGPSNIEVLLDVVAECTGYPTEMLDLDMDMESDLGIDSIKRVEILSTFSARVPEAPAVEPEQLSKLQTLRQVAEFIGESASPSSPATVPSSDAALSHSPQPPTSLSLETILPPLLDVVSECTGYPTEMLDLDMDMESDLGIDSIKRVEILSAFTERVPEAPAVEPEQLSKLQTLRQVAEFVLGSGGGPAASAAAAPMLDQGTTNSGLAQDLAEDVTSEESQLGRWRVQAVPTRLGRVPEFDSPPIVWITDDGSKLAVDLAEALNARLIDRSETNGGLPQGELDVLLLLDGGEDADKVVKDSFALIRALAPRLRSRGALLASITRQGGLFGFDGSAADGDRAGAGLSGLIKTCLREWPEVSCRVLDLDAASPAERVVDALFAEGPMEIGLVDGAAFELALRAESVGAAREFPSDGFVVVTGGARGVTAGCAIELAKTTGTNLLLLGRSPAPEAEPEWLRGVESEAQIKRALLANKFGSERPSPKALGEACARVQSERAVRDTLTALKDAGVDVLYLPADVRDESSVAAALAQARDAFGPVCGLIHGAGVLRDRKIEDKTGEQFDAVYDTKVVGLRTLLKVLASEPLHFVSVFTSVTGRFGRRGQADYAAANEALVKLAGAESQRRPDCRVVACDWGPWAGGMVTPGLRREFEREGIGMIPIQAGAKQCVAEVMAEPSGLTEVLLGVGLEASVAEWSRREIVVGPKWDSYLLDHQMNDQPVVPMAMILEWIVARTAPLARASERVEVLGLQVLRGVVLDGETSSLSLSLFPRDEQLLTAELSDSDGHVRARADVRFVGAHETPEAAARPAGLDTYPLSVDEAYETKLFHGGQFQGIRSVTGLSTTGLVAAFDAASSPSNWIDGLADADSWATDPLVVDCCFQAMILWCWEQLGAPSLPSKVDRFVAFRDWPSGGVEGRFFVRSSTSSSVVVDIDLVDDEGVLVARIEGYHCSVSPSLIAAFGLDGAVQTAASASSSRGAGATSG